MLPKQEIGSRICLVSQFRSGTAVPVPLQNRLHSRRRLAIVDGNPKIDSGTLRVVGLIVQLAVLRMLLIMKFVNVLNKLLGRMPIVPAKQLQTNLPRAPLPRVRHCILKFATKLI